LSDLIHQILDSSFIFEVSNQKTGSLIKVYFIVKNHLYAGNIQTFIFMSFVSPGFILIGVFSYFFSNHNTLYIFPVITIFCVTLPLFFTLKSKERLFSLSTIALTFELVEYTHHEFFNNSTSFFIVSFHHTKKFKKYTLRVTTLNIFPSCFVGAPSV
jgi:hypothetical protein